MMDIIKDFILKNKILVVIAIFAFLACLILFCDQAQAYNWKSKHVRFSAVAGETIAIGDVLCIKDADGYAYRADMDDTSLDNVVGVAGNAAASGSNVEVVTQGVLAGFTDLGEGENLYADSDPDEYTTGRLPGVNQEVGVAISTTSALIDIGDAYGPDVRVLTTDTTLTRAYNGKTITNTGATAHVTFDLPPATAGFEIAFANANTYSVIVNPQAADQILNLTNAAGDEVWFDAAGEGLTLRAIDSTNWVPISTYGTLTDGN